MNPTNQHTVQSWMGGCHWLQLFNTHPPSTISVLHKLTASLWKQTTGSQGSGSGRTMGLRKQGESNLLPSPQQKGSSCSLSPCQFLVCFVIFHSTCCHLMDNICPPLLICVTVSARWEASGLPYSFGHSWCLEGCFTLSRCLLAMTYWMAEGHFFQMLYFSPMCCPPDSHSPLLSLQFASLLII